MTRLRLLLVTTALVVSACTIPEHDEPVALSGIEALQTTTTTTTEPEAVTRKATVYMLNSGTGSVRLTPIERDVDVAADIQEVLKNLFTVRPDGTERPAEIGLVSAIPESAVLLEASRAQTPRRLLVDVRGLFGNDGIQGVDLRNALAQIVWTATEVEDIDEVVFRNNGSPVQALADDSEIIDGPVTREHYKRTA